jgi:Caspase domain/WD domain, G-beta repeat
MPFLKWRQSKPMLLALFVVSSSTTPGAPSSWVQYSSAPIAQIEVGGHSEEVRSVSVSADGSLLLTTSVDKTGRLWSAQTGQLEGIIRLPIDTGEDNFRVHEGKLYASALTRDGRWAVLAGYTRFSYTDPRPFTIYGVDLQSFGADASAMRYGEIAGLPTAVQTLALSPDGRWLAACLTASAGWAVFDWPSIVRGTPRLVHQETLGAGDGCYGVDFSPSGDLAISTRLGQVQIYLNGDRFARGEKFPIDGLARPKHLRYSPDGRSLAFGSETMPMFGIMQTSPPYRVVLRHAPAEDGLRGIFAVDWSADGRELWIGGERTESLEGMLYRVDDGGFGDVQRILTSERRIDDIRRLPNGEMAFVSAEPEVGVVRPSGRPLWLKRADTITVSPERGELRVNGDGSKVEFRPFPYALQWLSFSANAPADSALRSLTAADVDLPRPLRDSTALRFKISESREQLWINGRSVQLLPEERVLDHVIPADRGTAYVATSWFIRKLAPDGHSIWMTPIASEAEAVALTADGKLILAALTDGTIRWFRASDGAEILSLLALRNGVDWVAWIPPGYYESSTAGDNYFGWHLNFPKGPGQYVVRFYRAVQFDRVFYRPDVVRAYFVSHGRGPLDQWVRKADGFNIANLRQIAPPDLTISASPKVSGSSNLLVNVAGRSLIAHAEDWNLFVNGIPVVPGGNQPLTPNERASGDFQRTITVAPDTGSVLLRAESRTARSLGYAQMTVNLRSSLKPSRGRLFIVAAGVSHFDDKRIPPVPFAENDAASLVSTLTRLGGSEYSEIHSLVLTASTGHPATRSAFAQIEGFLGQASGQDTVVVFLASHGLSDPRGDYYFVPVDAARADIDATLSGRPGSGGTLVPWTIFFSALEHTAGHRILIVDTCSSSAIQGTFDAYSLAKRSLSSSFALLAASKGSEESQSFPKGGHGLFTYALLEALKTGYDPDQDGTESVGEVFEYAFDHVEKWHNPAVGPQTPQFVAPDVLKNWPLIKTATKVARAAGRLQ